MKSPTAERPADERSWTLLVLERVRLLLFLSDSTQRQVEIRAGFSRGYLSQLLAGTVEIKYWQLLAILDAMGIRPADFFGELFPRRHPALAELDELRHRRGHGSLSLELVRLYAFGIESIVDFFERLERCEAAIDELVDLGVLN